MFDLERRFSFGLNLDDAWRYAGEREPRSIIIPHLLSLSLPEGRVLGTYDESVIRAHEGEEPMTAGARASAALADNLRDLDVEFVRCWFPWKFFEPAPVPHAEVDRLLDAGYQSWPMDTLVEALTGAGVGIIPVLACGYQRMLPEGLNPSADPSGYLSRAAVHARLLARHYKAKIRFWQIENEPNWWEMHEAAAWRTGAIWLEGAGFRDELLGVLNSAVHDEAPEARTIVNLEGDDPNLDAAPFGSLCDLVGLDFYPNYRTPDPVDALELEKAGEVAREIGKAVFIAETGYPSGPGLLGYSEAKQAQYLEAACRRAYSLEGVNGIGIWRYIDGPWRSFPEQENHFGLIDGKGVPKEAWRTYGGLAKSLRG